MTSKSLIILFCAVAAVLATDKYTDKYDNINLDELKSNSKLIQSYANCILGKGKCTAEGKELREHLQEAIETGCEKCTEKQEKGSYEMIKHLIEHEPEIWNELCAKFDPEGKWRKTYEDRARAQGINIPN
ncbi:ejaculatory bulb-specific protein 3-like [Battus philenor]|uniref:ejaculatory bulb-specific protein 3-like n=1 Tax=Battus philenor TaxID=42288 RepID=UPI0035CF5ABB